LGEGGKCQNIQNNKEELSNLILKICLGLFLFSVPTASLNLHLIQKRGYQQGVFATVTHSGIFGGPGKKTTSNTKHPSRDQASCYA
jgi:hypothetical protein